MSGGVDCTVKMRGDGNKDLICWLCRGHPFDCYQPNGERLLRGMAQEPLYVAAASSASFAMSAGLNASTQQRPSSLVRKIPQYTTMCESITFSPPHPPHPLVFPHTPPPSYSSPISSGIILFIKATKSWSEFSTGSLMAQLTAWHPRPDSTINSSLREPAKFTNNHSLRSSTDNACANAQGGHGSRERTVNCHNALSQHRAAKRRYPLSLCHKTIYIYIKFVTTKMRR